MWKSSDLKNNSVRPDYDKYQDHEIFCIGLSILAI